MSWHQDNKHTDSKLIWIWIWIAEKQMILMIRIPLLLMATILHDVGDCYDSDESDDGDNSDDENAMVAMVTMVTIGMRWWRCDQILVKIWPQRPQPDDTFASDQMKRNTRQSCTFQIREKSLYTLVVESDIVLLQIGFVIQKLYIIFNRNYLKLYILSSFTEWCKKGWIIFEEGYANVND